MVACLMLSVACVMTGVILGAVVAMTYTSAAISHSQERMQGKVRQAEAEARYYQAIATGASPALAWYPSGEREELLTGPWFR